MIVHIPRLMSNARYSGNTLERAVVDYLINTKRLPCTTPVRLAKIMTTPLPQNPIPLTAIDDYLPIIPDKCTFEIMTDNAGRRGITSDVVIKTQSGSLIGFSCKRNNKSIKHQRPRNLARHLLFAPDDQARYDAYYAKTTKEFYEWCRKRKFTKFSEIDFDTKAALYDKINNHTINALKTATPSQFMHFLKYLTSANDPNMYIIYWNGKDLIEIQEPQSVNHLTIQDIENRIIEITSFSMLRILVGNLHFKFRLHTASSRIAKTIQLKYDISCRVRHI